MYAAIDHHKAVFQAAMLDPETGVTADERFEGSRDGLASWIERWQGRVTDVALEASTGWRWITGELEAHGFRVHLADPAEARARRGRTKKAKTDKLDARWLVLLLSKQDLPEAWIPPEEIQQLRAQTRLRKALADDRTRWAQRLHAVLHHEGWPCRRSQLLTKKGRQWVAALRLPGAAQQQVTAYLVLIETLEAQLQPLETELRRFAEADPRCQALMELFGVGPIIACHLLAEIGSALRFRRSRQVVRLSGLDPIVEGSGERRRRGKLAKQGPPLLRWAAVEAAQHGRRYNSPDRHLWAVSSRRSGPTRATMRSRLALVRTWVRPGSGMSHRLPHPTSCDRTCVHRDRDGLSASHLGPRDRPAGRAVLIPTLVSLPDRGPCAVGVGETRSSPPLGRYGRTLSRGGFRDEGVGTSL